MRFSLSFLRISKIAALALAIGYAPEATLHAQQAAPAALIADVVQKQVDATAQANLAYKYTLHKSDKHGNVVRVEIATPFGYVARTILREGKPLNAEANAYETEHLQKIIRSSSEQNKRLKSAADSRKDTVEIVRAMRTAMLYTLHPGQPQLPSFHGKQIVLDFKPNPNFHPDSVAQGALRAIEGTIWVDAQSHLIRRVEARSVKDFNVLLGIAVKVYAGAAVEVEQKEFLPGKLMYSKVKIDAKLREFLFKSVDYRTSQEASDVQRLPDGLTLAAAAQMLIDMPVPH